MAINKLTKAALKALSYPDINIKDTLPIDRSLRFMKAQPITMPLYKRLDHIIHVDNREIITRVYTPSNVETDEVFLFFHGGGWVTESIDTYNSVCKALSRATQQRVISVEYRLAPENPFPAGLEDCYDAAKEIIMHKETYDFPIGRITLIGDSAGGNLAAAVSLLARDRGEFLIDRQILIYPAVFCYHDDRSPFPSIIENGSEYLLTSKRICDYIDLYIGDEENRKSPYFAPLLASDLSNQPKTLVITAEFDPLRDEGEEYARRLRLAGTDVTAYRIKDALHGFLNLGICYNQVRHVHNIIYDFITEGTSRAGTKGLDQD